MNLSMKKTFALILITASLLTTVGGTMVFAQRGGGGNTQQQSELDNTPPQQQQSDLDNTPPSSTQATDIPLKIKLENPLEVDTVQGAIEVFMDAVIKIAIPFIVVFLIWSGLQFILAQGNQEKLRAAKQTFWYTIIGALLILGAWAITDAIVGTVNSLAG
jgi:hypothetical protein